MTERKYPTLYNNLFCDTCGEGTSHVSRKGKDYVCLVCEDMKREKEAIA